MESNRFLLTLLLIGLVSAATTTAVLVGSYQPIKDLNDPYVVEIAKFAVTEYNKKVSTRLVLNKIVSGEKQVVAGTNYKLIINVQSGVNRRSGAEDGDYEVIVYDGLSEKSRTLKSFQGVN